jgi:glycosyltransferase involved in cell wall biosynthesis
MRVALAVTHFERFDMVREAVAKVIEDERVAEVVISDDCSMDGSWEKLLGYYAEFPKVRLFRNEHNVDCYKNKASAIVRCLGDWVVLFDSDNIMDSDYLDRLEAVQPWEQNTAYLPVFAEPHFDYRRYEGLTIDRHNVAVYMDDATFRTALNTANHLCYGSRYVTCFDPMVDPHTADSIYMNYLWLAAGGQLHFVKGLRYQHRVHGGSHYQRNVHKTGGFAEQVEGWLRGLR